MMDQLSYRLDSSEKNKKLNDVPKVLFINPWIHDFAAYDFWAKPLGLLTLASILRFHGVDVSYIDCLDRHHPFSSISSNFFRNGRGPYIKTLISKPKLLEHIPRKYSRYGIPHDWFRNDLKKMGNPDVIMITSIMTYWYPGTIETIKVIKEVYPKIPIVLGGIYPSLCAEHATKNSGADYIISGDGESLIMPLLNKITGWSSPLKFNYSDINTYPIPSFDLQNKIDYIPILTTRGCPYNCDYCASNFLQPILKRRNYELIINEILYWINYYKVNDFVFYDDALLLDSNRHAIPMFKKIISSKIKVNFHTPNALHIREITIEISKLMFKSGFSTVRLGLETIDSKSRQNIDNKVTYKEFKKAAKNLTKAGFKRDQIGVYLLVGLPGQDIEEVKNAINIVKKFKIRPILAYYTPIPQSKMWNKAISASKYDLISDPIFTNNAILPSIDTSFSWKILSELKKMANY